jgi:hypothetical protein
VLSISIFPFFINVHYGSKELTLSVFDFEKIEENFQKPTLRAQYAVKFAFNVSKICS